MWYGKRSIPIWIWLLITLSNITFAQDKPHPGAKLSLADAWQQAAENNKVVQMEKLGVQVSAEELRDARAERLPEVSVEAEYARISNMPVFESGLFEKPLQIPVIHKTYTAGAEAYFNLYNGQKTRTAIQAEEVRHELAQEQQRMTAAEIRLRVAAVYLDLQRNIIFRDLIEKNIVEGQRRLKEIRELHKNGVVLRSDVLRAELQLSKQQMSLVEIQNNIVLATQKLDIYIGLPDTTQVNPDDDIAVKDLALVGGYEELINGALAEAFPIRISQHRKELSDLHLKTVLADNKPKIGAFANYKYSYPQIFFYPYANAGYMLGMAGLKISYPISSLYHNSHKEKAARLEMQREEIAHADAEEDLQQAVQEGWLRFQESQKRMEVAQMNIRQAQENYRIVHNTYFNQLALVTDLLDADTQLLQSRFDLATAQIATRLKYFQLLNAIGKL